MGKQWPEDLIAGHVWLFPFRFAFFASSSRKEKRIPASAARL
jgi:hypothetical protein